MAQLARIAAITAILASFVQEKLTLVASVFMTKDLR